MDQKRLQALADYLAADEARAARLLNTDVADAQNAINADGYDFTIEEMQAFSKGVAEACPAGDTLDEAALEKVSGGVVTFAAVYIASVAVSVGASALRTYGACRGWWR